MSEERSPLLGRGSLWNTIREVAESEGVQLFDLDMPGEGGGALRVYITRPMARTEGGEDSSPSERRGGVSFEDCVRVSKRLLDIDEESAIIPENCLLEVSSPGINRRLRRPEHFAGAVGERVKVKFRVPDENSPRVVTGTVESFEGEVFKLKSEDKGEVFSVHLSDVKEAKVDFRF
jgi:ribosome maturation factor RimP